MRRSRRASLAVAFLLALSAPAYADWQTVTSPEGRFAISFPDTPKPGAMSTPNFEAHSLILQQPGLTLSIAYKDYKPGTHVDADQELRTNRDQFLTASNSFLLTTGDASVTRGGKRIPALLFTFNQGAGACDSLIAVEDLRVYQLIACHVAGGDATDSDRFLKSFTLPANGTPSN
jgi:hypothetical protein